ncbi:hypothetical protein [Bradyrhizobium diazoefficiens]|nr:hypothetical protein XF16B_45890 [Bradyrhizobium diazoefficiens]BCF70242.1 hypothetical protein XF19B_45950 [Bradyrhizobium diazoefficiens]
MTNSPANNPKTLGQIALNAAVKSVGNVDSACYDATVALGLVLAAKQLERMETGETLESDASIKANKATFRAFLKEFAFKGNPVWRDTAHIVDAFAAMKPETRRKAAAEYIDKKAKGSRLIDGLARLKTQSMRLMADVVTNHADTLRNLRALKEAGADANGQMEHFHSFVAETYGTTYAALESALAPTPKQKQEVNPIDAMLKRAGDMTMTDLAILAERIQALYLERVATEAAVTEAFADQDAEVIAEATPELIAA